MRNEYFASLTDRDELGRALMERVRGYQRFLRDSGRWEQMLASDRCYYGRSTKTGARSDEVTRAGEGGEYAQMRVNHYRNIAQHMLNLCTSQRPAPQPIASNSDARTHEQVALASGLLDYYSREKRVERKLTNAAESAIARSEGYVETEWDTRLGDIIEVHKDPVTGQETAVHEGDLRFTNLSPADVTRDPTRDVQDRQDWLITRHWVNRFEVIAKYPEYRDLILALPQTGPEDLRFGAAIGGANSQGLFELSDEIPMYRFMHEKTAAVPQGRLVVFLADNILLTDTGLPYPSIPVRRIAPADHMGTGYGYTPMYDLLALQQALDALYSIILTNQTAFGIQTILAPAGHNLAYEQISRGLALLEYDSKLGRPEALNLTATPQEIFNFIRQIEEAMETISGINSTVRGNPEASLKSGSALALVQSQAIQFSSGLQASYARLVEDVYTDALNILKAFAKTKRVVAIVGKHKRHMLKSFMGDDISLISRVVVDSGSALSKTASGRIQIAQDLLQNGLIKTPEQYLAVVTTGTLDPVTESDQQELILIRGENEALAEGRPVYVTAIDSHRLHIMEHRGVLANAETRSNPVLVAAVTEHIQEHIQELREVDPALLALIGEQSLALPPMDPAQAGGGSPPAPGGPQGGPPPPGQLSDKTQLPALSPPKTQPTLPINPQTGVQWNAVDGGDVIPVIQPGGL